MLIKGSFSAYRLYSKNVALLCLGWWTLQLHFPLHGGEDVGTNLCCLGPHVESGESRSLHDEDFVADGIR